MILHVVKSLVGLPSVHALGFVGVIVGWTGPGVRLVDSVLRGSLVGHPVVPEEYPKITNHVDIKIVKNNMIENILQGIEG